MHGFWNSLSECKGVVPDTREGASMTKIKSNIYIFGGFSRVLFNDLKVLNLETLKWNSIPQPASLDDPANKILWPKVRS